jgi:hypothetical protein
MGSNSPFKEICDHTDVFYMWVKCLHSQESPLMCDVMFVLSGAGVIEE